MGGDQTPLQIAMARYTRHQQSAGCDVINPAIIIELANQLQGHKIDVEAMVVGCDGQKDANLYRIDHHGLITCHSDIGFMSIGSGGIHSSAHFMTTSFTHATTYYRALYHTFVAKKKAEVDPYVGIRTDMFLLNRDGVSQVPAEIIEALEAIYSENIERERNLPAEAAVKLFRAKNGLYPPQPSEPP